MSAYPVGPVPNNLSSIYTQPYMIRNSGSVPVYLGQDSSLSPGTRSITLDPGAALMWSGETELWAVTDAGTTSEVELLFTGSGSFIPGPSTVSVSARVEQIYNKPVQPITNLTTVLWDSAALGVDLSSYASLVIAFNDPTLMTGLDTSRLIQIQVIQYDSAGFQVWVEAPTFYGSGLMNYTTQIRGASIQVTALYVGGANTGNISVRISGSQIDQGHKYYQVPALSGTYINCTAASGSTSLPTSKWADVVINMAANVTALVYIPSVSGMAYFQFFGGNQASESMQVNLPGTSIFILPIPVLTPTARTYLPPSMIPFPESPVIWQVGNSAAAQSARMLISWE